MSLVVEPHVLERPGGRGALQLGDGVQVALVVRMREMRVRRVRVRVRLVRRALALAAPVCGRGRGGRVLLAPRPLQRAVL